MSDCSRREFLKAASVGAAALMTPHWAFGQAPSKRPNFVFILMDDLSEQRDRAQSETWRAAELRQTVHAWRESVGAQMPLPNPNYDPARAAEAPGGKAKGKAKK